jgi:hypothetical protein
MVGLEEDEMNHKEINATTLYRRMTSFLAVKLSCGHIATTVVKYSGSRSASITEWVSFGKFSECDLHVNY